MLGVVGGQFGEELEGVYFGGGILDAQEDGADGVGEFECVGGKKLGLVDGEVD